MNDAELFASIVERHSALPLDRIRIVTPREAALALNSGRGVIFILAAWSGQAVTAFKRLTKMWAYVDTSRLELLVTNTDGLDESTATQLWGTVVHGYGESIWFRAGEPLARVVVFGADDSRLMELTHELLEGEDA